MRVLDIIPGTSVDGPGLRTAIYFAGCTHQCPGCHNPQSWDAGGGHEISVDEIVAVVDENGFDVTFTGGDPLFQAEALLPLARELHRRGYGIWCYTGYLYEAIVRREDIAPLLDEIDVLVDGPFVMDLRDVHLRFRGSSNQRLIDLRKSTPGSPAEWRDDAELLSISIR
ncbi:MAG: anaerobic ribonucleoside-triphosphate reductase activating protein [Duncaniella sp.]|nr:anaerobic ribonucleoside-triphosphate reductase activating protein [Duncaniella sp.]